MMQEFYFEFILQNGKKNKNQNSYLSVTKAVYNCHQESLEKRLSWLFSNFSSTPETEILFIFNLMSTSLKNTIQIKDLRPFNVEENLKISGVIFLLVLLFWNIGAKTVPCFKLRIFFFNNTFP